MGSSEKKKASTFRPLDVSAFSIACQFVPSSGVVPSSRARSDSEIFSPVKCSITDCVAVTPQVKHVVWRLSGGGDSEYSACGVLACEGPTYHLMLLSNGTDWRTSGMVACDPVHAPSSIFPSLCIFASDDAKSCCDKSGATLSLSCDSVSLANRLAARCLVTASLTEASSLGPSTRSEEH